MDVDILCAIAKVDREWTEDVDECAYLKSSRRVVWGGREGDDTLFMSGASERQNSECHQPFFTLYVF